MWSCYIEPYQVKMYSVYMDAYDGENSYQKKIGSYKSIKEAISWAEFYIYSEVNFQRDNAKKVFTVFPDLSQCRTNSDYDLFREEIYAHQDRDAERYYNADKSGLTAANEDLRLLREGKELEASKGSILSIYLL